MVVVQLLQTSLQSGRSSLTIGKVIGNMQKDGGKLCFLAMTPEQTIFG